MCGGPASGLTETVVLVALDVGELLGRGGVFFVSLLLSVKVTSPVACCLAQLPWQGPVLVLIHVSILRWRESISFENEFFLSQVNVMIQVNRLSMGKLP